MKYLAKAKAIGADKAMNDACKHINKADTELVLKNLKEGFLTIGEKAISIHRCRRPVGKVLMQAAQERGQLDFIDYPLNNRWWLEDELKKK